MKEKRIPSEQACRIKARHDAVVKQYRKYVEGLSEKGAVWVGPGLALIKDLSLLEENSGSQGWCALPYKLASTVNKGGCPNHRAVLRSLAGFGQEEKPRVIRECPPTPLLARTIFDLDRPVYVIVNEFQLGKFAEKLRRTSQKLTTPGGWYNVRYWQNVARKELYGKCQIFLSRFPGTVIDLCPEAHGVDLTKVMIHLGINLEFGVWPPPHSLDNVRYQICLGGYPKSAG